MKRFLPFLLFLICASAQAQGITPYNLANAGNSSNSTFGNNTNSSNAVGTTANCTTCGVTLNVPGGALIILDIRHNSTNDGGITSVTDTAGDTFSKLSNADSGASGNVLSKYFTCNAIPNAAESFQANFANSFANAKDITPTVYTGNKTAGCNDGNGNGATNSSGGSATTSNMTTTGANELVHGSCFFAQGGETQGASFTKRSDDTTVGALSEDRGAGGGLAQGSYAATCTGTSGTWGISGGLFLPAACNPSMRTFLGVGSC